MAKNVDIAKLYRSILENSIDPVTDRELEAAGISFEVARTAFTAAYGKEELGKLEQRTVTRLGKSQLVSEETFRIATGMPRKTVVPPSVVEWAASFNSQSLDSIQQQLAKRRAESEYVGFNVRKLIEKIRTLSNTPVFPTVQEDIAYGVMLFMERGSAVVAKSSADSARMSQEGFNQMQKFIEHYQKIAPKVKGATTVTLPRWSICFPRYRKSSKKIHPKSEFPFILTPAVPLRLSDSQYSSCAYIDNLCCLFRL